jgi:dTDP-4-amino-4,6-dideoxygalactose transaminase
MKVQFVDLQAQFRALKDEVMPAVESVFSRAAFILGDEVGAFERAFADYHGAAHCVGVNSGCDALLCALKACNIGPGDEVIVPDNTYIASVLAISAVGATPVLVDCLDDTCEMDVEAAARAVTPKTKALLPVHLYGQAADMGAVMALARAHGLKVIEDAAQAHGARTQGRLCGTIGDVGCFSFYPGKNLGAYGDGGAIVTQSDEIAEAVRQYRNYGQSRKYYHDSLGWNARLDTVQAAILGVKLKYLDGWNAARRAHAAAYRHELEGLPIRFQTIVPGNESVFHLMVIRVERRDELIDHLGKQGVACGIHYPVPVHLQKAYAQLGLGPGAFPVTERMASEMLSLPIYPELTPEQIQHVGASVRAFFGG